MVNSYSYKLVIAAHWQKFMEKHYNLLLLIESVIFIPLLIRLVSPPILKSHYLTLALLYYVACGWPGPDPTLYPQITASGWIPPQKIGGIQASTFLVAHLGWEIITLAIKFGIGNA